MVVRNYRIALRRDTSSAWVRFNPVLLQGEAGYELDTNKLKIGDGSSLWNDLPYITGEGSGPQGPEGPQGPAGADGQDGAPGVDGQDGKDGAPGVDGQDGAPGVDGQDGKDGAPGVDGQDGAPGVDGQDGKDGADGQDGQDGQDGADGQDGKDGADGQDGQDGADGQGVPAGGTTGQILSKTDATDYNTEWVDAPSGGSVGTLQQVTDLGNTTTNDIIINTGLNLTCSSVTGGGITSYNSNITNLGSGGNLDIVNTDGTIRIWAKDSSDSIVLVVGDAVSYKTMIEVNNTGVVMEGRLTTEKMQFPNVNTLPTTNNEFGDVCALNTDNKPYFYDGTSWREMSLV